MMSLGLSHSDSSTLSGLLQLLTLIVDEGNGLDVNRHISVSCVVSHLQRPPLYVGPFK